jgi:hypothetical protein
MKRRVLAILFFLFAAPALGQDLCQESDGTYRGCFERIWREGMSAEAAEDVAEKITPEESPEAANGLRNFLPNFLGALGLGDLSEDDGTLTFTVNPELLSWGSSQFSLQTILRESTVFEPLIQAIPEAIREERQESLGKQLDPDFGDVEASLTWTLENEHFGRDYRPHRKLISDLYADVDPSTGTQATQRLAQFLADPEISLEEDLKAIRKAKPAQSQVFETALVEAAREIGNRRSERLETANRYGFFRLADLINNQKQIYVTGAYRSRDDLVGQDEWFARGTFEYTFQNLSRWEKTCKGSPDLECLQAYFAIHPNILKYSPRLTITAEVGETSDLDFALPDDNFVFHLDEIRKQTASLVYGQYLSLDKEGNQDARLDIEAKYEDVSGDPLRNERFVSTATITQKLPTNLSASVTLVYANKPEYRGDVDEELSARVGLRFKMDPQQP